MKLFESLLQKALHSQNNLLLYIENKTNVPDLAGMLIDPYSTKSFKDLSLKLLD